MKIAGRGDGTWSLATVAAGALLLTLSACGSDQDEVGEAPAVAGDEEPAEPAPAQAYWANLSAHCGEAFPGSLTLEPPGDPMLDGDELLVVHFDHCSQEEIRLPFHIEAEPWDRSRTWIFRWTENGRLELRHDHRQPDGTEDEVTWYGGFTEEPGTAHRQEFYYPAEEFPERVGRGWRIEIHPGERYTYGTIREGEWSWRVDFDLSEPLEELPPPAWGYEEEGARPRR